MSKKIRRHRRKIKSNLPVTRFTAPNGAAVSVQTKYGELLIKSVLDLFAKSRLSKADQEAAAESRHQLVQDAA